jgi:iron complex transport system substrate-binding protein
MNRIDTYNGIALLIAVGGCLLAAAKVERGADVRVQQIAPAVQPIQDIDLGGGKRGLRDASGAVAPLKTYTRIASASLVADEVLWELIEPDRLVAVTQQSKTSVHFGHRHAQRAGIDSPADLEPILALHPDLLFISHFGDPRYAAHLRAQGIVVFDLGEMHGLSTLLPNMRVIGKLIGAEARADALARAFAHRLQAVAADIPEAKRPRALYLSAYGKQLYGGALGTSYHDVLTYGGAVDAAAPEYHGWPSLGAEDVLRMDPEVLVTKRGMSRELCRFPGFELVRACQGRGRIIELDADLADDPGLPMLEAAESLREQLHATTQ